MIRKAVMRSLALAAVAALAALAAPPPASSHGEKIQIIPAELNVRAGSPLKVQVLGLTGAKTATFRLTGLMGSYELGEFAIDSDDFEQMLQLPDDIAPGSYRLTVEGGGNSAKVVITIN